MTPGTDSGGQVFVPESAEGVMRQAELLAMRALTDQIKVLNNTVGDLAHDVKDVRERLIRVESNNWQAALDREVTRVNQAFQANSVERLRVIEESTRDRRRIEDKFDKAITNLNRKHDDDLLEVRKVAEEAKNNYSNLTGKLLPVGSAAVVILAAIASYIVKVIH